MRGGIVIAGLIAACAPTWPHGLNDRPKDAQQLHLRGGHARVDGVVSYVARDRIDWYRVDLRGDACDRVDVAFDLATQVPIPGMRVAFDVLSLRDRRPKHGTMLFSSRGKVQHVAFIDHAPEPIYVRVWAMKRRDAGVYRLRVDATPALRSHELGCDHMSTTRPWTATIAGTARPRHQRALLSAMELHPIDARNAKAVVIGAIPLGMADRLDTGMTGVMLDRDGHPIAGTSFVVGTSSAVSSTARFTDPLAAWQAMASPAWSWTADIAMPSPTTTRIGAIGGDAHGARFWIGLGAADGVSVGTRGHVVDEAGDPIAGTDFTIVSVEAHTAEAGSSTPPAQLTARSLRVEVEP